MIYVTQFESDLTKSFSQTAFHNIKSLQEKSLNFELRPLSKVLNWDEAPSWMSSSKTYFSTTKSSNDCALVHLLAGDLPKSIYKSAQRAIAVTAIETSLIPQWLAESINENYKGVIVPSEFSKTSMERSGVSVPIYSVPHALHPMWLTSFSPPPQKDENVYVFGYVGNWNARKNPKAVLDAYLSAFPQDTGETALFIKTYNAGDIMRYVHTTYGEDRSDIWIYDEMWSETQMLWAFSMIDCFVSAHKGEGFGLALAQAAALGKPVIYTDYSAPCEWLSSAKGHYPIKCEQIKVAKADVTPNYSHMLDDKLEWAEIDTEHLKQTMQSLFESKIKEGFSTEDLVAFRHHVSWSHVGEKLVTAIESIMGKPLERKQEVLNAEG